ncbi:MAG TPA: hypothetical protein PJ998_06665 [Terrimesophilobacter sp.]|nr:hypothetical protein [Terrimesophilobacter sp.]
MTEIKCPSCSYAYQGGDLAAEPLAHQQGILEKEHPYHGEDYAPYKCSSEQDVATFLDRIGELQKLLFEGKLDPESGLTEICARGAAIIWYAGPGGSSDRRYDDIKLHELLVDRVSTFFYQMTMGRPNIDLLEWMEHEDILSRYEEHFAYLKESPFS